MRTTQFREIFISAALGFFVFYIVCGYSILFVDNIGWLNNTDDSSIAYLAWEFFRAGPWLMPFGLNPNFGLELSTSIVQSNSIPIFAFIFKIFTYDVGGSFQYWGIWLLTSFLMQAYFLWLLIGLATRQLFIKVFGTLLVLFCPLMLYQASIAASTTALFPILAALYLILRPTNSRYGTYWSLVLVVSLLIHPILLAINLMLWLTSLLDRFFLKKDLHFNQLLIYFIGPAAIVNIFAGLVGYFESAYPLFNGYGSFQMNLFAPFDSSSFQGVNWSSIFLIESVKNNNTSTGFSYLGLGMIILIILAITRLFALRSTIANFTKKNAFFLCLLGLFILIALSDHIRIASWQYDLMLPSGVLNILKVFTYSGRFFWPVYYFICITSIFIVVKAFSPKISGLLILICCFLQIADEYKAIKQIHKKFSRPQSINSLNVLGSPFWDKAGHLYAKTHRVPIENPMKAWKLFAEYSLANKQGTDSIHIGLATPNRIHVENVSLIERLKAKKIDQNALYIIEDSSVILFSELSKDSANLLARIDGFNVFAPNWNTCNPCNEITKRLEIRPTYGFTRVLKISEKLNLSSEGLYANKILISGWSTPEKWGVWSKGDVSKLTIPLPDVNPEYLILKIKAFNASEKFKQIAKIKINNVSESSVTFSEPDDYIKIKLSPNYLKNDVIEIEFTLPNAISPKTLGISDDDRKLALGIEYIVFK